GDHRQRPALRDESGRPDPDPADGLARPHQRKRSPHHLVRCRQYAANPRGRRPFLRAGRPAQQRVLAGRPRRRGLVDRSGPARGAGAPARGAATAPKSPHPGEPPRGPTAGPPAGADGMRVIRYVNPATGGAVMPTLDCYAARLSRGTPTRAKRTTYNVVCLVVAGEGRSHIGEETFEWSQHDVFTIPHWTF